MAIIRPKDKIEKYLDSLSLKHQNCEVSTGTNSRYYNVAGKVLRVSDHVGVHSEAYVSIIIPAFKNNNEQYIIHAHNCGQISVVDYKKVKEIVRSFFYLSSIFGETSITRADVTGKGEQEEQLKKMNRLLKEYEKYEEIKTKATAKGLTVLGIPADRFSKGQLKTIESYINQMSKKVETD